MELRYAHHPDAPAGSPPQAVRAGDLVFTGANVAAHPVSGVPEEAELIPGYPWHGSSVEKQLTYVYRELDACLTSLGSSLRHMTKINSYHLNPSEIDMALRVRKEWFDVGDPPPSTLVLVPELPVHGPTVAIDSINVSADSDLPYAPIRFRNVPVLPHVAATGWAPFAQAVRGGGFVFTRGTTAMTPSGPARETMPDPTFPYTHHQIRFQTRYVLEYLQAILGDAGCSFDDVVRAEVHLRDMADLATMDTVWSDYFPSPFPARVVVPTTLAIPSIIIEIELIATDPTGPYRKELVMAEGAPTRIGPESQAIKAGPYLFLSGLLATDYATGVAPGARVDPAFPFHQSPIRKQVDHIQGVAEAICAAGGTALENLVRRRAHFTDLGLMAEAEHLWQQRLPEALPPTTTFRVDGHLPVPECLVQYDLIAAIR
jgi:enamine deaminase RidA (YjgF/YER057c/UK114 family)